MEKQLVVFNLLDEVFGVDIQEVKEIIPMERITRVPRTPKYVAGVVNLRGQIIPVIDLKKRFGIETQDTVTDQTRIIITEVHDDTLGMIVDGVNEVLRVSEDVIEDAPDMVTGISGQYLGGIAKVEKRLIILLDLAQVMAGEKGNVGFAG